MISFQVLFAKLNYNHTLWHPLIQTISQSHNGTIHDQQRQKWTLSKWFYFSAGKNNICIKVMEVHEERMPGKSQN
jgi:hypothetical protein